MRFVVLGLLLIVGCEPLPTRETSEELTEPGWVDETVFTPATHGSGMGMSMKGTLSIVSVNTRPEYAVVFRCQHGKFIVKSQEAWKTAVRGDSGTIYYKEIYQVDKVGRHLEDYDFLRFEKAQ